MMETERELVKRGVLERVRRDPVAFLQWCVLADVEPWQMAVMRAIQQRYEAAALVTGDDDGD